MFAYIYIFILLFGIVHVHGDTTVYGIRFCHFVSDGPAVDVYVNSYLSMQNVAPNSVSEYSFFGEVRPIDATTSAYAIYGRDNENKKDMEIYVHGTRNKIAEIKLRPEYTGIVGIYGEFSKNNIVATFLQDTDQAEGLRIIYAGPQGSTVVANVTCQTDSGPVLLNILARTTRDYMFASPQCFVQISSSNQEILFSDILYQNATRKYTLFVMNNNDSIYLMDKNYKSIEPSQGFDYSSFLIPFSVVVAALFIIVIIFCYNCRRGGRNGPNPAMVNNDDVAPRPTTITIMCAEEKPNDDGEGMELRKMEEAVEKKLGGTGEGNQ